MTDVERELASLERLAATGYLTPRELDAARARVVAASGHPVRVHRTVIAPRNNDGPATADDPDRAAENETPSATESGADAPADQLPLDHSPAAAPVEEIVPPPFSRSGSPWVVLAVVAGVAAVALGVGLVSRRSPDETVRVPELDVRADAHEDAVVPTARQTSRAPLDATHAAEQPPTPTVQPGVPLPDTVGLGLAEARAGLAAAGFERVVVVEQPAASVDEGTVIRQTPPAGGGRDPDRTIRLTVAAAPTPTPVPTLTPITPTYGIVTVTSGHPSADAVGRVFDTWTTGLNTGDYGRSFSQYTGRLQQQVGFEAFASGNRSSQISDFVVESIQGSSPLTVLATFTSRQDASDGFQGQPCSVWRMEYELTAEGSALLINRVRERTGGPDVC